MKKNQFVTNVVLDNVNVFKINKFIKQKKPGIPGNLLLQSSIIIFTFNISK